MAELNVNASLLGNALEVMLTAADIEPGSEPSYQLCKTIYTFHPLGGKMVDSPLTMAQSQKRDIAIPKGPEERLKEAFERQWEEDSVDKHILNAARLARIYGIASSAVVCDEFEPDQAIPPERMHELDISFNQFDPLNTAGSLVLNQQPNAVDYQKTTRIRVSGKVYHRSRAVVIMNEQPLYIEYTNSAFGFVGRSVYQRALFPLKSFIQSMITDDMVTRKAGVLIAKMKPAGSIISNTMQVLAGVKRALLKEAETDNVLTIDVEEDIGTLNMQNLDGAYTVARTNLLKNTATAADMPAKLLENETMVSGFGEGVEDAKNMARYIERIRLWMGPLYDWHDRINMHRAWNPNFYETIQRLYPNEYGQMPYQQAFHEWANSFKAQWPSLLIEPESQRIVVDDVKLRGVVSLIQVLQPDIDPANKARLYQWAADNFNDLKLMFGTPLNLDWNGMAQHAQQVEDEQRQLQQSQMQPPQQPQQGEPLADSGYNDAVARLKVMGIPTIEDRVRRLEHARSRL